MHRRWDTKPAIGLPGGDRTPDPQLRRLLLYPTELRAEIERKNMVGAKGFEPSTLWSQTRMPYGL